MRKRKTPYQFKHVAYSILMLLALSWLTISAPFVYRAQQQQQEWAKQYQASDSAEEDYNPFSQTNEEKSSNSSSNFSEEYLHHAHNLDHHFITIVQRYNSHCADEYLAFHPESFSPPPEA